MTKAEVIILLVIFFIVGISLWFVFRILKWLLRQREGDDAMKSVSNAIREGADAFLFTQYQVIAVFSVGVAVALMLIYFTFRKPTKEIPLSNWTVGVFTAFSFLFGALCSGLSGWAGMWVSVRANVRAASAARKGIFESVKVCLYGGIFSGILIVALSLLGVSVLYVFVRIFMPSVSLRHVPSLIIGYGFGASFVALFAQLGGGIYTKAADVGADIVGKIDLGIPEDDPRNPAVIADLVGDNVGDCAGRGADLFESTAAENIGAMILGATLVSEVRVANPSAFILFPLFCRALALIATMIGVLSIGSGKKMKYHASKKDEMQSLNELEENRGKIDEEPHPMSILNRGFFVCLFVNVIFFFFAARVCLYSEEAPKAWFNFALCGLLGIILSLVFLFITEYYTEESHRPVKSIAKSSEQGHGTNIIAGLSAGLESTGVPTLFITLTLLASYSLGATSGLHCSSHVSGVFGTACATIGMLVSAAYVLAMDTFGPIADNAGGIAEMSGCAQWVRERVDKLDAVGNTTKALTKGYAVGSAALAAFLLFSAFLDDSIEYSGEASLAVVDIAVPEVFCGAFIGIALVFVFSALAIQAVGNTAQLVVVEVKRQFAEHPGILDRSERPEYGPCVTIVTRGALREMIYPCVLVLCTPLVVGIFFRYTSADGTQGVTAVAALLMAATIGGVLMGLFLNTSGGAWDNAKKFIETGQYGGKGSPAHQAAVTGDTVGDPCKDTAGPSLHVLVKLLSSITLVLYPMFVAPKQNIQFTVKQN